MKTILNYLCLLFVLTISSCAKDEKASASSGSNVSITVYGRVLDESGNPLEGVSVRVGSFSTLTDVQGLFVFENALTGKKRAVIKASKNGYWNRSSGFIPSDKTIHYCNLVMPLKQFNQTTSAISGGNLSVGSATVTFPANAFAKTDGTPYTGVVKIASHYLGISDPNFSELTPGGDFLGENTAGEEKVLISFGMLGVELQDNVGNPLQLMSGKKATISMPIDPAQLTSAPSTLPLWHFDENTDLWKEEGLATRQGSNYIGEVSHFSWWNYDWPGDLAVGSGKVTDCLGRPVANALVTIRAMSSVASGWTNQAGIFSGNMPANVPLIITATYSDNTTAPMTVMLTSGGSSAQTFPDMIVPCTNVGMLEAEFTNCNNQLTTAYVTITALGYSSFIVAQNGKLNTPCPEGPITVKATNMNGTASTIRNLNIQPVPVVNLTGPIKVCGDLYPNTEIMRVDLSSTVTGNIVLAEENILLYQVWDSTQTKFDAFCYSWPYIGGVPPPDTAMKIVLEEVPNYIGVHSISNTPGYLNAKITYYLNGTEYIIRPQVPANLSILNAGAVGTLTQVHFNGPCTIYDSANNLLGTGTLNDVYLAFIRKQ
ncbi:MAG: carboxypeptidase regulatory-like domain-containing protein [Bacteroidetes bacterium]|nr:carboxypeptidase regulatory-like domain-containing protein [Bacteroidota bacterium]